MYKIIVQYVVIMSIVTFIVFGADKGLAKSQEKKKKKQRISEDTLMLLSMIGGCYGSLISMYLFRHKINKAKFKYGIPATVIAFSLLLYLLEKLL
jgi:uncharacterized membrane protein YsdA (DUF1294 family)